MLAIAMVVLDSREGEFKKKKNCKNKIKKKKNHSERQPERQNVLRWQIDYFRILYWRLKANAYNLSKKT